ncbi:hypothetical protein D3C80_1939800 [compost metagenome]
MADVERDTFLFEQGDNALGKGSLSVRIECGDVLVDDLQADRRVGAGFVLDREIGDPAVGCDEVEDHLGIGVGTRH